MGHRVAADLDLQTIAPGPQSSGLEVEAIDA